MSNQKNSDDPPVKENTSSIIHMQEFSSLLTPERLDGTNYVEWSLNAENKIRGRKKWGFISGKKAAPEDKESEEYETWQDDNCMIKSWLLDAMTKDVRSLFIRLPTAKEIWETTKKTYSVSQDASKAYRLYCEISSVRQNGGSVITYFGKLQKLWQELDAIENCTMECPEDVESYTTKVNSHRVYVFLAGLDSHLDGVRGRILSTIPLPDIQTTYANVCAEANRQETMLHGASNEGVAMIAKKNSTQKRGIRKCTYCNGDNHLAENCFKLHGYPEWHPKGRTGPKIESSKNSFVPTSTADPAIATGLVAQSGTSNSSYSFSVFTRNRDWIIDTGATDHMTCDHAKFTNLSTNNSKPAIINANGISSPVTGMGSVHISPSLSISNVLFVPSLNCNLLSVSQLTESHECVITFFPTHCVLQNMHTKEKIGSGKRSGGLYYLELEDNFYEKKGEVKAHLMNGNLKKENEEVIWLWHRRLGHPSFGYLRRLFPSLFLNCNPSNFHCETCVLAKSHRVSFPLNNTKVNTPFSLIHTDVWGPAPMPTQNGMRWFVTFVDDCTRMTWLYLLKHKSDVVKVFKCFQKMVEVQFQTCIKVVRSDNGGEYFQQELKDFMNSLGIIHQTSCPYTPQQNGVAERKNRHLLDVTRSLLIDGNVPTYLWGEALSSAVYLINRVPSSILNFKRPLNALADHCTLPPNAHLEPHIFGCVIYVHLHSHQRTKLEPRAMKCVFVGYSMTQKGYRAYHPPSKRFYVSMDVTFHEHELFYSISTIGSSFQRGDENDELQNHNTRDIMSLHLEIKSNANATQEMEVEPNTPSVGPQNTDSTRLPTPIPPIQSTSEQSLEVSSNIDTIMHEVEVDAIDENQSASSDTPELSQYRLPPRSNRGQPKICYEPDLKSNTKYPIGNYVSSHKLSRSYGAFVSQLSVVSIPNDLQEALADPRWTQAMDTEMAALKKNSTWQLVQLPKHKKTVGCRWVFTIKHAADGTIERYKARLVAKGYTQSYGIDYQDTFAPVAKLNTVRVLLSLAANLNWPLLQFDVKNAFLHGELCEEVYMDPPPGISEYSTTSMVCKLKKALYGLKQSPRAWFGRFTKSMKNFGYKQSNSDHTLFIRHSQGKITALIIYVDDMIVTGNDYDSISRLQKYLASEFEMKKLGDLKYFLGIEVARSKHGIFLSQRKYILDLLSETGMLGCKPVNTPIEQNHKYFLCSSASCTDKGRYQRLVGKLIYLSHTRPDIAYAVNVVSQFMHDPRKPHMDAVERILRYLKFTPGKGILFSKHGHLRVDGYTDADWAGSADDRRSTSGYFTFVGGNLVTWRSKKQHVVARSSAKAEFRGMALGVCELLWLKTLLEDIGFGPKEEMKLHCDNTSAIEIAHNPVQHDRTKHVEIDRHFIKEKLEAGIVAFPFVKSEYQLADILTKGVSRSALEDSFIKLGMHDIHAPT